MCEVDPEHIENAEMEKGKKVLHLEMLRALCGCTESEFRWHELCSETMCDEVVIINPHARCVANKVINGKQCTIVWHAGDNRASHVDPIVVTEVTCLTKKTLWGFDSDHAQRKSIGNATSRHD